MKKGYLIFSLILVLIGGGIVSAAVVADQTQSQSMALFGVENANVLFTSTDPNSGNGSLSSLRFGVTKTTSTINNNGYQEIFLSPDRKLVAVTAFIDGEDGVTGISDLNGNVVVKPQVGDFVGWSPDSQKVLLFVSDMESSEGRAIYYLGTDGSYSNSGLPKGVIDASISPKDGSIAYVLTNNATDDSNIYIRNTDVSWDYPAIWSSDGSKITFTDESNVFDYDIASKSLSKVTNFAQGTAEYPQYSSDGQTIIFSSDSSGSRQIWSARNDTITQITTGEGDKDYSVLP